MTNFSIKAFFLSNRLTIWIYYDVRSILVLLSRHEIVSLHLESAKCLQKRTKEIHTLDFTLHRRPWEFTSAPNSYFSPMIHPIKRLTHSESVTSTRLLKSLFVTRQIFVPLVRTTLQNKPASHRSAQHSYATRMKSP
jgi:hypothetical protein